MARKAIRRSRYARLAIVGLAYRFPGAHAGDFWQALLEGRDLVTTVDGSRWSTEAYLHPRESEPGCSYTFAAGSLGDVSGFDAAFFGISPREAAQMDPQQRLLLELTWEALESGGIRPSSLRSRRIGVHIGFSGSDYLYRHADDPASLDAFVMTGCTASVAANRISYYFDLRGPSMAIDTACSSALTAFHQSCQSVLSGESEIAITGAVNLHLHPLPFIAFSKASMLSRRGACRAFDASGDGYVRSEGGAIAVLKPLEQALADGNRIFAVVAGTAVNCDGKTNGLTVPSLQAQVALLREAYEKAGIDPAEVDYVEAHGTGTAVGDPIEAAALGEALGRRRPQGSPLPIGSVKTNVGHMEAAAGMAGIVKAIHCLQQRVLPPSIHFEKPNPRIAFDALNLEVVSTRRPLPQAKRLVIGINSFGFGGANGHVILESPPVTNGERLPHRDLAAPLLVTARSEAALRAAAASLAKWLRERTDLGLYEIAYSAAFHRDWHPYRAIVHGDGREALAAALERLAAAEPLPEVATGRALPSAIGPVFVYSGNGSQWAGMGRALFAEDAVFRAAVEEVDRLFAAHRPGSIVQWMQDEQLAAMLERTEIAQPLLFAVQVGITERLRAWGIRPTAALGHSVGEIAAAWACGALTLAQAVEVVAQRSAWQETTRDAGAMSAVQLGEAAMRALIEAAGLSGRVAIAASNSPRSVTVAADASSLAAIEAALAESGASFKRLPLRYAFHSAAMDPIEDGIRRSLAHLRPATEALAFYSTVTGGRLEGSALDAGYWWRNIREPVRFEQALGALRQAGATVFVEIGPRPVLAAYLKECLGEAARDCAILPTMAPKADGAVALRRRADEVLIAGCPVDLTKRFPVKASFVELPAYPWQRERHWYEPTPESLGLLERRLAHPLLGYRLRAELPEWENRLDIRRHPALADHRVGGEIVFPAAGFIEMALAAAAEIHGGALAELEDFAIHAPLVLEAERSRTVRLAVDPEDGRFAVRGRPTASGDASRVHASGRLPASRSAPPQAPEYSVPERARAIAAAEHYRLLAEAGLDYGPAFRAVSEAWVANNEAGAALAQARPPVCAGAAARLDPGALDACFQLLVHLLAADSGVGEETVFLPVGAEHLQLLRPGAAAHYVRTSLKRRGRRSVAADCRIYGEDRRCIAILRDVRFRAASAREAAGSLVALRETAVPAPLPEPRRLAPIPPIAQLHAACAASLHGAARLEARRRYYAEVEPLLEAMLRAFAREALHALAGDGGEPRPEALLASGAVPLAGAARLERLLALSRAGDLPAAAEIWAELIGNHPDHSAEIIRLGRVGLHLADLVRGTATVQDLLQGEPEGALAAPETADFGEALAAIAARALEALPPGERLRALVVQPQEGDLAGAVRAALDSSRSDLAVAGPDSLPSGPPARFDLVFLDARAAPAQRRQALAAELRALLADGGLLAILEPVPTHTARLVHEIVSAGARAHADAGAQAQPCEAWRRLLAPLGFAPQAPIADLPDHEPSTFVLLARAEPGARDEAPPPAGANGSACWLVVCDESGYSAELGGRLARELLQRGREVRQVKRPPGRCLAWGEALGAARAQEAAIAGIVVLAGLDPDACKLAPGERLERQIERCAMLGELFEACSRQGLKPACWVVTARAAPALLPQDARGASHDGIHPDEAPVWGFVRVAANEYPGLALRLADIAEPEAYPAMARLLAECIVRDDGEDEIVLAASGRYAVRLQAQPVASLAAHARAPGAREAPRLEIAHPGQLRSLTWVRRPLAPLADDEVEIEVHAAGLNFRDVMIAVGQLPEEAVQTGFAGPALGMELAGTVRAVGASVRELRPGERVLAFAASSFTDRVVTKASTVLRIPDGWSFEAAATVPIAFLTAYYALHHLAHLSEGERVLIHGAAGGVGLAAIQLAQLAGAEIFATAGSDLKRDVLRLAGAEHVLDSRTLDFAGEVLERTGGHGVDVVLNSLAGEAMRRSLQILKPLGRFLELGKRDYYANTRVGLRPLRNNVSYFAVDVDQLMYERPAFVRRMMSELMALFEERTLRPLPYRAFAAREALEAFRHMQQSRHIGKVVLRMNSVPPGARAATGRAILRLRPEATYLVTGGLGGFGLRTACWLADKGARHLLLLGRRADPDAAASEAIAALRARGVQVRVESCDVADHVALQRAIARAREVLPPFAGVVHAAGVIEDSLIRNLGRDSLRAVLRPKVLGALNLDRLTRGARLDFFVLYSSATTALGNAGQANYVAANRFLEALAERRRAAGEPALCVGWGPIEDAGYLARNPAVRERLLARIGAGALRAAECLAVLEHLLAAGASATCAVLRLGRGAWARLAAAPSRRFAALARLDEPSVPGPAQDEDLARWLDELDDRELAARLAEALRKEAAEILRIPVERLEIAQPLQDFGMDSLMGVELASAIEARFGVEIPALALAELGSIERLAARLVAELRRARSAAGAPELLEQARRLAAAHSPELGEDEVRAVAQAIAPRGARGGEARTP